MLRGSRNEVASSAARGEPSRKRDPPGTSAATSLPSRPRWANSSGETVSRSALT